MTEDDLRAIVEGLAPVVRAYVTQRLAVCEAALGQMAERASEITALRERVAVLEARPMAAPVADVSADDRLTLTLDTDPDRVN